jgi:hypothetical protein
MSNIPGLLAKGLPILIFEGPRYLRPTRGFTERPIRLLTTNFLLN